MTHGAVDLECAKCRLHVSRKKVVPGTGNPRSRLVLIGEAPGRDEDLTGIPFVGAAGRFLQTALGQAGIDRDLVYITNLVKCRPPGNRKPRADEVSACMSQLEAEIRGIRPVAVCLLGQTAVKCLLGDERKMRDIESSMRDLELGGVRMKAFVTYHPAACIYGKEKLEKLASTLRRSAEFAGIL